MAEWRRSTYGVESPESPTQTLPVPMSRPKGVCTMHSTGWSGVCGYRRSGFLPSCIASRTSSCAQDVGRHIVLFYGMCLHLWLWPSIVGKQLQAQSHCMCPESCVVSYVVCYEGVVYVCAIINMISCVRFSWLVVSPPARPPSLHYWSGHIGYCVSFAAFKGLPPPDLCNEETS